MTAQEKEKLLRRQISAWHKTDRRSREKVMLALRLDAESVRTEAQAARDRELHTLADDLMHEAEAFDRAARVLGLFA